MNPQSIILNPPSQEWLEADGLGGFASGTSTGIRTRRYHALLLTATTPPTGRIVLVNGFDAWVETANGTFSLSSQCYAPDVIGGDGAQRIEAFGWEGSSLDADRPPLSRARRTRLRAPLSRRCA